MSERPRVFPITAQAVYYILRDTARAAGLGRLAPHDLRRSNARLMREGGASLEQIQAILGHSNIQTTSRYLGSNLELRPGLAATDCIKIGRLERAVESDSTTRSQGQSKETSSGSQLAK